MSTTFENRRSAGQILAKRLKSVEVGAAPFVLGLPRGGVPVAFEIALALDASLDVFTVRKLGVPGHEELAMGAIATGGMRVINQEVIRMLGISVDVIDAVGDREEFELRRREQFYRHGHAPLRIEGRAVIVVDDGIATGSTMLAAVNAVKSAGAARVIAAAPVAAMSSVAKLRKVADEVVVAATPEPFYGVGQWYQDFSQTTDSEVQEFLRIADDRQLAREREQPLPTPEPQ